MSLHLSSAHGQNQMPHDEVKSAYEGEASDTTCNKNLRTETNCSSQNAEARFRKF